MTIRVNLPDGSVANFPDGMDPQSIQTEIEQYLAQGQAQQPERRVMTPAQEISRDFGRLRDAVGRGSQEFQENFDWQQGDPDTQVSQERPAGDGRQRRQQGQASPDQPAPRQYEQPNIGPTELNTPAVRGAGPNTGFSVADALLPQVAGDSRKRREGAAPTTESRRGGATDVDDAQQGVQRSRRASGPADFIPPVEAQRNPRRGASTQGAEPDFVAAEQEGQTPQPSQQPQPNAPRAQGAGLPSIQNPNAGGRTNVAMPRGLSIEGAREQGRGEKTMSFSMSDGQTVQVRAAPPAAVKNGVKSGMDFLMERADQIMLTMLKNGDIAGATSFREFVRGEQAQKGMTYMNRAVVASNYGDTTAFTSSVDAMVKAFDPDGDWQVDTKGTRLIQTDNGQAVGATLSLRNKTTGEVLDQEYMGMQNVVAALSDWGSPTAAFERQQERVAGAVSQKIANAASYQEAFDKAMADMFDKSSFVDLDGNAIGQDEMQRRQQMVVDRIRMVRPDLVPTNAAPAAPPQGAASGVGSVTGGSSGLPVPTWGG